jgi:hypothetical protein
MSLLRAKPLDFESTWLVLQRQVVSWLVYCLPCAASGCSPYGACARVRLRTGCVWFVLRERQVSRLVIDLSEGVSHSEFMQMHTLIYKLCTISQDPGGEAKAGELYFRLQRLLIAECKAIATQLLQTPSILELYVARWNNFSTGMVCVNGLFDYLNRYWIRSHCQGGELQRDGVHISVRAMGVAVWREHVQIEPVSQRMLQMLWDMSMEQRAGSIMDYGLAKQVLAIYAELGSRPGSGRVYKTDFQDPYVEQTQHMYSLEAAELTTDQDCSGYVLHAHDRVSAELLSASKFMLHETLPLLCTACERAFITEQRAWLQNFFDRILVEVGLTSSHPSLLLPSLRPFPPGPFPCQLHPTASLHLTHFPTLSLYLSLFPPLSPPSPSPHLPVLLTPPNSVRVG